MKRLKYKQPNLMKVEVKDTERTVCSNSIALGMTVIAIPFHQTWLRTATDSQFSFQISQML